MDELELLKKEWKRQETNFPRVEADALYKMIHKKSSSLTKWILIIAILEFVFWTVINVVSMSKESMSDLKQIHLYEFDVAMTIFQYVILGLFIYWFYRNYRMISSTDNTRQLMQSILKVRKTVNIYVIYNLAMVFIIVVAVLLASAFYDPQFQEVLGTSEEGVFSITWGIALIFMMGVLVLLGIFWLFYKLLYGILLRRLHRNYKELNRLEIQE